MMHNWFLTKIRYEKVLEDGTQKKVTDQHLVDAISHTEAEARIIEEMSHYISGEFTVVGIVPAKYKEVFFTDDEAADKYYKCKLAFITLDEKSGAEKKTFSQVLVQASDLRDAIKKLDEGMRGSLADYEICSVTETPIWDVYTFKSNE